MSRSEADARKRTQWTTLRHALCLGKKEVSVWAFVSRCIPRAKRYRKLGRKE
jgi:DnaJ-class molecular chaperone